jgi:hypothetical protein
LMVVDRRTWLGLIAGTWHGVGDLVGPWWLALASSLPACLLPSLWLALSLPTCLLPIRPEAEEDDMEEEDEEEAAARKLEEVKEAVEAAAAVGDEELAAAAAAAAAGTAAAADDEDDDMDLDAFAEQLQLGGLAAVDHTGSRRS